MERPEWQKLMKVIKPSDTIIFDEVSRMSRNADEGFKEYERLFNLGVNLVFLRQHHIDTSVYKNALNVSIEKTGHKITDLYVQATNDALMLLAKEQIQLGFQQAEIELQ